MTVKPCLIEWRLTTDSVKDYGMHTFYPWGIVESFKMQGQRIDLRYAHARHDLQMIWDDGIESEKFVKIVASMGEPAFKFLRPTMVTEGFDTHQWFMHGYEYSLELRIKAWLE